MTFKSVPFFITTFLCLAACRDQPKTVFTEVPSSETHIDFRNDIKENVDYNILTYEYLYNGGGVAVGDLNNDGLPDIIFTGNMVPNKLYLNKGNFQFEDITDKAGLNGRSRWKTGVVMADVNGDGLLDIYVCYSGPGTDEERCNELYINQGLKNGVPVFKESAKEYGLDAPGTYTTSVAFFDMDNDGDLDMFMVNHADMFFNPYFNTDKLRAKRNPKFGNRLYRNDNGHFTDVSDSAHIYGSGLNFGLSAAISDVNNDGWPDIYVTNDYDERDFLYLNNHDGTFREVLAKAAGHISEFAMGSDIADYNNDGNPDIMVLDMLPEGNHRQKLLRGADSYDKYSMRVDHGFHHQQMRNTLQLNNGTDSSGTPIFSEEGQMAGVSNTDWSWAPLFADFDNDGWKDLFISNGILRDMTNLDFVKYTSGYSSEYKEKNGDKFEMWKLVQDMPSTKLNNYLFRNDHDLRFTNVTSDWGITKKSINNGAVYADLDNDGDLDLVINNLNDNATLYRNNTSDNKRAHFLKIRFKGEGKNTFGIGAKLYVQTAHGSQMQEEYTARGFQSSVDPIMHIGLGADSIIQMLKVKWPGGKESVLQNVKADTLLVIDQTAASPAAPDTDKPAVATLFRDVTQNSGIRFADKPSAFVDFKISPLLPYQLSKTGPCLAKADVNGDGLEDLFIGASSGQESILYLQTKDGKFIPSPSQPWNTDKNFTNTDALFFDADGDGHPDLYIVSGGADYPLNSKNYQDRIFENDGHGHFKKLEDALPAETISGACVRAADIDHDGLPDLFVGGRIQPGLFPEAPESFILKNKSVRGKIRFEKDISQTDSLLVHPGMVTDALWLDLNKDGWEDLIVIGQFMPIRIFENQKGRLTDRTAAYGLSGTDGWWCRILAGDFDHDGDTDLVVGNLGLNTQFKATPDEPLTITYADFNQDGIIDPILSYYNGGKSYPYFTRDEMLRQVPGLQKKFSRYADYADAQITDLFGPDQLGAAKSVDIKTTKSIFLRNEGNGTFTRTDLPDYAQMSVINGMIAKDVDGDGHEDIILAGNFFPFRVQQGPLDAGIGLVLKGDGKGGFTPLPYDKTGLCLTGDVRNIMEIKTADRYLIVVAKCNGSIQVVKPGHK
ncbi:MAG: VCBS repeat-containing protein [Chitinophagales bacterium]